MKVVSQRYDFARGTVTVKERILPDKLPVTPLVEHLIRKGARK